MPAANAAKEMRVESTGSNKIYRGTGPPSLFFFIVNVHVLCLGYHQVGEDQTSWFLNQAKTNEALL